jgi:hypothetical protein
MTKRDQLIVAIRSRQVVAFTYDGRRRVGNPHTLGDINGRLVLEFYQTAGSSNRGGLPAWRTVSIESINSLELTEDSFAIESESNSSNVKWDSIVATVR